MIACQRSASWPKCLPSHVVALLCDSPGPRHHLVFERSWLLLLHLQGGVGWEFVAVGGLVCSSAKASSSCWPLEGYTGSETWGFPRRDPEDRYISVGLFSPSCPSYPVQRCPLGSNEQSPVSHWRPDGLMSFPLQNGSPVSMRSRPRRR